MARALLGHPLMRRALISTASLSMILCMQLVPARAERLIEIAEFISAKRPYVDAAPWWAH